MYFYANLEKGLKLDL